MRLILTALMALVPVVTMMGSAQAATPLIDMIRGGRAELPQDIRIAPGSLVVSRQDMLCLALNDYWEARGESLRGRVAVAQVVLNRARDPRFPKTLCEVIADERGSGLHGCQFSWFCDGRSDVPTDTAAWRSSVLLALSVLRRDNAINDPSGGAIWYHNTKVRPDWSRRVERTVRIGGHIFYKDPLDAGATQAAQRPLASETDLVAETKPVPTTFADWIDGSRQGPRPGLKPYYLAGKR
ncbi:cell wall hydrolase [Pararhodospirillum photometricum]|nr:cell wall hydrolase [Pararhodospirillum photometricum]